LWKNRISVVHKDVFLGLTAIDLNVHLESNSIESLPEPIFDDHTFDTINIQHNPFKNMHFRAILQNNCKIANFYFDCKNLDEKTLQQIVDWAYADDVGYCCGGILYDNATLANIFGVRQSFCALVAGHNCQNVRSYVMIMILIVIWVYLF
jgi:hypothetical protein